MTMLPKEYASKKGFLFHTAGVPLFVFGMLLLFSPTSFDRFSITWPRYCNNFSLAQFSRAIQRYCGVLTF